MISTAKLSLHVSLSSPPICFFGNYKRLVEVRYGSSCVWPSYRWLFLPPRFPSVEWQDLSLHRLFMTAFLFLLSARWSSVTLTNEVWSSIWAGLVAHKLMMVFLLVTFSESFWNWFIPLLIPLPRRLFYSVGVARYISAIYGKRTANSPSVHMIIIYLVTHGTVNFTLTQF